jgi:hypothetical protein
VESTQIQPAAIPWPLGFDLLPTLSDVHCKEIKVIHRGISVFIDLNVRF